jgi:HK97 family phage major capsid protein
VSETLKKLNEQAMSCLHLARSIHDQYPDQTKMPADKVAERKALLAEGQRLRGLAEIQRQQDELEGWAAAPAEDHPAMKAMAEAHHSKADMDDALAGVTTQLQTKAFLKWIRGGTKALNGEEKGALRFRQTMVDGVEQKASLVENALGEIIVPHDITGPIFKELPHLGTFRASGPLVRRTSSNKVDVRSLTNATAGWSKLETGGATVDANVVPNSPADVVEVHDLIALSKVGEDELADTDSNLTALIQQIVGLKFAEQEDDAFANGSGSSRPFGLAMRATAGGPLITQGVTAASSVVTGDDLKSLPFKVPTVYRNNGVFYVADDVALAMSLLKDGNSNYLWQPSVRAGEPPTWSGYRVYTLEGLPAMTGTSTPSAIFGDPSLGYMIADRQQVTMQRLEELYSESGQIGFRFKLRVGGDVIRPKAFAKYIIA